MSLTFMEQVNRQFMDAAPVIALVIAVLIVVVFTVALVDRGRD